MKQTKIDFFVHFLSSMSTKTCFDSENFLMAPSSILLKRIQKKVKNNSCEFFYEPIIVIKHKIIV